MITVLSMPSNPPISPSSLSSSSSSLSSIKSDDSKSNMMTPTVVGKDTSMTTLPGIKNEFLTIDDTPTCEGTRSFVEKTTKESGGTAESTQQLEKDYIVVECDMVLESMDDCVGCLDGVGEQQIFEDALLIQQQQQMAAAAAAHPHDQRQHHLAAATADAAIVDHHQYRAATTGIVMNEDAQWQEIRPVDDGNTAGTLTDSIPAAVTDGDGISTSSSSPPDRNGMIRSAMERIVTVPTTTMSPTSMIQNILLNVCGGGGGRQQDDGISTFMDDICDGILLPVDTTLPTTRDLLSTRSLLDVAMTDDDLGATTAAEASSGRQYLEQQYGDTGGMVPSPIQEEDDDHDVGNIIMIRQERDSAIQ
jgi:hypothetical protein